jgi:hypothetical protein
MDDSFGLTSRIRCGYADYDGWTMSAAARDRLVQWFLFGVIAAVIPLGADALIRHAEKNTPAGWADVIGHGELLLVTVALAFPAFGAILMSDVDRTLRGVFGGFAVVTLFLIALLYASIAHSAKDTDPHFIVVASIVLFLLMLGIGTVCVAVAKIDGEK